MSFIARNAARFALLGALACAPLWAQDPAAGEPSDAEIAEMVNNPLSHLWMLATQDDFFWMDGDVDGADKIHANVLTAMPIMPMQLTEDYKLILRPWVPLVSTDFPRNAGDVYWDDGLPGNDPIPTGVRDTSWDTGLGDMGFWAAIASNEAAKPPFVWGVGLTAQFDTASEDQFGSGRNSVGPMGLAFYVGEEWIVGGLFQHWWDYAGDDDRGHVNKTNFQYVLFYRLTPETKIGMSPNVIVDWQNDTYDLPVGLGANTLVKIGSLPITVGVEVQRHFSDNDAIHNQWHLRLLFVPILPSPGWSKKPLF
jgi:hypothetical protein